MCETRMSVADLKDTEPYMESADYKERFFAEYAQTKIRYERLKAFCNRIEASHNSMNVQEPEHDCPYEMLREQQKVMGQYLHILEVRAVIEEIDIRQKIHEV
ncbi:MAG: hypothetical protein IJV64_09900 [Oscillospiraceae bacterium]|nr:hypothetical protein [Oscillospiraceae bacterium]